MHLLSHLVIAVFIQFTRGTTELQRSQSDSADPFHIEDLPQYGFPPTWPSRPPPPTRSQSLPARLDPPNWWNHRLNQRLRIQDRYRGSPRDSQQIVARLGRAPVALQLEVGPRIRAWIAKFGYTNPMNWPGAVIARHIEYELSQALDRLKYTQRFRVSC